MPKIYTEAVVTLFALVPKGAKITTLKPIVPTSSKPTQGRLRLLTSSPSVKQVCAEVRCIVRVTC